MSDAIVIGAGPAGLTSAYELSKLGLKSTVVEADNQVGGLSRTVCYRGFRFDIGGHRFFSKVPLINEIWDEILRDDFLVRPRLSRIYYREHFFDYPLKAANALVGLGPIEALLVMLSYGKARLLPHGEETNFEQWVSNRFGYRLYNIFFKTYTEKVWGIPCTEVSADWAAQRIKNLSLQEALRNALFSTGRARDGKVITSLIEQFNYPRLGPGMMWERCEELLAARGHETVRGVKVNRVRHRNGRVECVYGKNDRGEAVEFGGEHFISSMPLRRLIEVLDPGPPEDVLQAARSLRYRDYQTVVLIVNRESVFPDNWIYIHAPEVKVGRVQNYKNWSSEMVPDESKTSLGLEYFLWENDEEWRWSHDRLIELAVGEAARIGLVEPSEVEDGTVVRMKKAYPIYDQDYRANIEKIRRYLETFSNLQTVGRNGLHCYNNQDHSMLTGIYAARNVVGEKNDVWSVNTEMEYHEEAQDRREPAGGRLVPARVPDSADSIIEDVFARVDPIAMGSAVGIVASATLFIATAFLLLKGGPEVGPHLSLLSQYLIGFEVSWSGAVIGLFEMAFLGFVVGFVGAAARNIAMSGYAHIVRKRAESESRKDLLERI